MTYQFYAEIENAKYTGHFFAVDLDKCYLICDDIKVYEVRQYSYQANVLCDEELPAWYLDEGCVKKSKQWVIRTIPEFIRLLENGGG